MMRSSKKGQHLMGVLRKIIIATMVGILILVVSGKLLGFTTNALDKSRCDLSTWANTKVSDKSFFLSWPIDCPAPFQEIVESDDSHMQREIANHLEACWSKLGGGGRKVFRENWFLPEETNCLVCSGFSVNREVDWIELSNMLATEKIPPLNQVTYSESLNLDTKPWIANFMNSVDDGEYFGNLNILHTRENLPGSSADMKLYPTTADGDIRHYWVVFVRDPARNTFFNQMVLGALKRANPGNFGDAHSELNAREKNGDFMTLYVTDYDLVNSPVGLACENLHWQQSSNSPTPVVS